MTTRCAWVVLVMIGDKYVPGALVVAQSIRETNTNHDLVCMVTPEVSHKARTALEQVYTKIIQVPYVRMPKKQMPRFVTCKQRKWYARWIDRSFTKWNIFNPELFGEYDKVMLLDADMVFIKNCDVLFNLEPPAMTFSTPWAVPYCQNGGIKNYYLHPRELRHDELVSHDDIRQARVDGFVGRGSMVLARPDKQLYDNIVARAAAGLALSKCVSGFDEQVLADAILELGIPVRNIHQQYNWVVGKDMWLRPPGAEKAIWAPYVYQWYGVPKPWLMTRTEWPDLKVWWNIANNVMRFHRDTSSFFDTGR